MPTVTEPSRALAGRYLYGFIEAPATRQEYEVPAVALPGAKAAGPVYMLGDGPVAAVVSDSPLARYPVARQSLLAHEAVIEFLTHDQEGPVLPVKYGTVAGSEAILLEQLRRHEAELLDLLSRFRHQIEVSVKAIWQREQIFAEIARQPEIAALKERLVDLPPAQAHATKLELGQLVERQLQAARERDAEMILAALRPLATDYRLNAITLDMLVLNSAFLIERDREAEFDDAIYELDAQMGDRLRIKYAGPLPPFNFTKFNLSLGGEE